MSDLQSRYDALQKRIDQIKLQNEVKRQKLAEYRKEIQDLGFNPDNLDVQMGNIKKKIELRLGELEQQVTQLTGELGDV